MTTGDRCTHFVAATTSTENVLRFSRLELRFHTTVEFRLLSACASRRRFLLEKPSRHDASTPAQPTTMKDQYQDVIRGSPVERKPDRAALDAAIDRDAGTSTGAQDHSVQPLDPADDPQEDLSGAQTRTHVEALPQQETALIDYDLGKWNSLTRGSTTQDGWVQRWSFELHIVHFPSNFVSMICSRFKDASDPQLLRVDGK